ncbi:MAG: dodecin family protein [Pseudomonadota bacterium]
MAVLKVLELLSDSSKSWEDAAEKATMKAAKSVKNIRSVYVQDMSAVVDAKGKIKTYRVTCKVTFEVGPTGKTN